MQLHSTRVAITLDKLTATVQ